MFEPLLFVKGAIKYYKLYIINILTQYISKSFIIVFQINISFLNFINKAIIQRFIFKIQFLIFFKIYFIFFYNIY